MCSTSAHPDGDDRLAERDHHQQSMPLDEVLRRDMERSRGPDPGIPRNEVRRHGHEQVAGGPQQVHGRRMDEARGENKQRAAEVVRRQPQDSLQRVGLGEEDEMHADDHEIPDADERAGPFEGMRDPERGDEEPGHAGEEQ